MKGGACVIAYAMEIYTTKDIEALPEGVRAELIDGQLYLMGAPSIYHQRIIGILYRALWDYTTRKQLPCEPILSPCAVFLNDDDYTYVEPDLIVVCDKEKLDEKGCHGAPDLVIEVVSESSRRMDYAVKLFKYRSSGVREYWIIDQEKDRVIVYCFDEEEDRMEEYTFAEKVRSRIYEGLEIELESE